MLVSEEPKQLIMPDLFYCCSMPREDNPNADTAVETMSAQQFQSYLENRRSCLASLNMGIDNYPAKRKLLENAVKSEKSAAEFLRTVAALTVMAGADDENLTAAKRTALLVSCRQNLFEARKNLIFVKLIATDGFSVAHEAVGGGSHDDLLSNEEKKRIEEARKKSSQPSSTGAAALLQSILQAAGGGPGKRGNSNLLSMMAAGDSRPGLAPAPKKDG